MASITVNSDGFANPTQGAPADFAVCAGTLVGGAAVAADGEAVTFADFTDTSAGSAIDALVLSISDQGTHGATLVSGKVKYFNLSTGAEATGDLSAHTFQWVATLSR